MKKLILALGFISAAGTAHALTGPFVQITTGTLQPNTTNGFFVSSGTALSLNVGFLKSTGTFTLNGTTETWNKGVVNGTKTDNSTTTNTGNQTFLGNAFLKNGIAISTLPANGALFFIGTSSASINEPAYIQGSITNDNAPTGYYGESLSTKTVSGTASAGSTGTNQFFDIVSIAATAGDWDFSGVICGTANGATLTDFRGAMSSTIGNSTTGMVDGDNVMYSNVFPSAAADQCLSIPAWRQSINATTTFYLKCKMAFSVATPKAYGRLSARRVR